MTKVLCLFPLTGNGGIVSWAQKFIKTFPNSDFEILTVNTSPGVRFGTEGLLTRIMSGLKALYSIYSDTKVMLQVHRPKIIHTTTSGSIGALRDVLIAKLCKKNGIKCILHNHYGCIPEDYVRRDIVGRLVRHSFRLYNQIWVLDRRTYDFLSAYPHLRDKIYLTPNPIEIVSDMDNAPKTYMRVGFVGNLIPTKGIFELVEACTKCNVRLDIIGPGTPEVLDRIRHIAGDKMDKSIFLHGKLPNEEAVKFMKEIDIVALPTYYPWEAFPISILEAMSQTKMVISCPRAAIPDMLTDMSGNKCGQLVESKSSEAIRDAIEWCQTHTQEADNMCREAYEKVWNTYRTDIVYDIYRNNYTRLL